MSDKYEFLREAIKNGHTKGSWVNVGSMVEIDNNSVADICSCDPRHFGQKIERDLDEIFANAQYIAAAEPKVVASLLRDYDQLREAAENKSAPDRMITDLEVARLLSCNRSWPWKLSQAGRFPSPVKLSPRCTRWRLSQVREWMADPQGWQAARSGDL